MTVKGVNITEDFKENQECTGVLPLTEKEREWMEENMVNTAGANLNSIGLERVNAECEDRGAAKINNDTTSIVFDYTDIIKKTDLSKAKTTKWHVQYKGQDAIFSDMYIKDETKNAFYVLNGMYTDGDYSCKQKELFLPCIIDIGKQWNLKFNWPLNAATVTKQNIFVRDTKGNEAKVAVKLNSDKKTVRVTAPQEGYSSGRRYILNVTKGVKTQGGNCLTNEAGFEFIVK